MSRLLLALALLAIASTTTTAQTAKTEDLVFFIPDGQSMRLGITPTLRRITNTFPDSSRYTASAEENGYVRLRSNTDIFGYIAIEDFNPVVYDESVHPAAAILDRFDEREMCSRLRPSGAQERFDADPARFSFLDPDKDGIVCEIVGNTRKPFDYVGTKTKSRSSFGSSRTYRRGPRGGCYYINSNGNKTYVDRSKCR